jgi:Flp pilus assembly protein protease CpaA
LPLPTSEIAAAVIACSGAAAAAIDLRTRRIPNRATFTLAGFGVALAAIGASGHSVGAALGGLALGLLLMLPGHLFGATGAGDVKLFAAMGTLLGPAAVVSAFVYTAVSGGILAGVVAVRRRRLKETMNGVASLVATRGARAEAIEAPARQNRIAYAPAIAIVALLAALGV